MACLYNWVCYWRKSDLCYCGWIWRFRWRTGLQVKDIIVAMITNTVIISMIIFTIIIITVHHHHHYCHHHLLLNMMQQLDDEFVCRFKTFLFIVIIITTMIIFCFTIIIILTVFHASHHHHQNLQPNIFHCSQSSSIDEFNWFTLDSKRKWKVGASNIKLFWTIQKNICWWSGSEDIQGIHVVLLLFIS